VPLPANPRRGVGVPLMAIVVDGSGGGFDLSPPNLVLDGTF
jgi:hypothetical protein